MLPVPEADLPVVLPEEVEFEGIGSPIKRLSTQCMVLSQSRQFRTQSITKKVIGGTGGYPILLPDRLQEH